MSTSKQTSDTGASKGGFTDVLRGSFQAGLGIAEKMHQFAVEVPLNMLPGVGVSEEQATALKDKHRNLLRGVYGSIDSVTTKGMDFGVEQAKRFTAELKGMAEQGQAEAEKVVAKTEKTAAKAEKTATKAAAKVEKAADKAVAKVEAEVDKATA